MKDQPSEYGTFVRSTLNLPSRAVFVKNLKKLHIPKRVAIGTYRKMKQDEIYVSKVLGVQVNLDKHPDHGFGDGVAMWHLSIKFFDKSPIHDWRILQRIKNELCGPEREAIELYPAESRVVDTSNQYHLFVFPAGVQVPIGWTSGAKTEDETLGNVQRKFDE